MTAVADVTGSAVSARASAAPPAPTHRRRVLGVVGRPEFLVFLVAVLARLTVIVRDHGINGLFGYDAGVYFAGSDALIHGRLPYADYVQLHPPGITVALTPFAALTKVMSDSTAFTVTIFAFTVLGAVNAALVVRVARRLGLGRAGALVAGLFYALWMGSVSAEYLIKLEPLANALMLVALLLALRAEQARASTWRVVLAGVPLGLAVSVKIWWVVPVAVVIVWFAVRARSARRGLLLLAGAAGAALVLNTPFFLAAPRAMWSMVITDQLSRPRALHTSPLKRAEDISSVSLLRQLSPTESHVLFGVVVVLAVAAVGSAWRVRAARPVVVLAGVQFAVVQAAPSWFPYYCDYLAIAFALVAGAAAARGTGTRFAARRAAGTALAPLVAVLTVAILLSGDVASRPFEAGPALARTTSHVRCVMTDSPAVQIRLDALSRGLAAGCPNWVDITGPSYGPDRAPVPRVRNPRWQRDFLRYLREGQAVVLVRGAAAGEDAAFQALIAAGGAIVTSGHDTVWRVAG